MQARDPDRREPASAVSAQAHQAVELIGRRWTGVIVAVLIASDAPLRFSDIGQAVPDLSDRMLSERLRELEERGLVDRDVQVGPPMRIRYGLTEMGRGLEPAMHELRTWAQRWL